MQPAWQAFQTKHPDLRVTYRMAGLLPSWKHFSDNTNAISKPIQMGPEWMHARVVSGASIDDSIWISDPPASSWPACVAVKAAGMQSQAAGEHYLFLLQQAVMTERANIAKATILLDIAARMAAEDRTFDSKRFEMDLVGSEARDLFRRDMQEWKYLGISRLPALIIKNKEKGIIVSGYQTLDSLDRAIAPLL